MPFSRAIMWIVILVTLVIGAGLYWFFTREFKGQAAETVNIAHTEALTGSSLGLVGYWTFDGNDVKWSDTTTEIKDTSGNSKHGDAQGSLATTSATSGKTGQALSFNGTSDVVSLGNVYNGVKTVAFWVKPNTTTQPFIDLNGTATINVTTGTVAANSFTSPTIYVDGTATSTFPDTNWHHVVVTTGTGINASAVNLGKISSSYFGGILDDVRFYSSTLSSTQVTDLYRASSAKEVDNANHREALTNGLVGYWTFDGRDIKWSDANEIKDISGNGNHGDAQGSLSTTSVTPGKLGQALSFNGTSDSVSLSYSTVNFEKTSSFSISAWIRVNSSGFSNYQEVLIHQTNDASETGYDFIVTPSSTVYYNTSALGAWLHDSFGNSLTVSSPTNSIVANVWYHIVMTYSGNSNASGIQFSINGVSQTMTINSNQGLAGSMQSTASAYIGAWHDGSGTLIGTIDDVRVYNRVLSQAEITNLYNVGK